MENFPLTQDPMGAKLQEATPTVMKRFQQNLF